MRKERRNLLLAGLAVVALVGGLLWQVFRSQGPPEPVYQGKRLSAWLSLWNPGTIVLDARAEQAVRQIGTNGIPTYLRMLRERDSHTKLKLIGLAQKQHLIEITIAGAEKQNWEALQAFTILGAEASNAVPDLIQIYEENTSDFNKQFTARALGGIGPAAKTAVPALLRNVTNTGANGGVRLYTVIALGRIHADPESVAPVLINCLKDRDQVVRGCAVQALGSFGSDARAAVPALVGLLKDPEPWLTANARLALKQIDPEAAAKAGIK